MRHLGLPPEPTHSFIIASCVREFGFEVDTLEKLLYVRSPLGTRVSMDLICRCCELEISRILLTMDLMVMDMSEFDVILGMDWLTAHQVVIDYESRRVTAYTQENIHVTFQGDKELCFTPNRVRLQMARAVNRLASKPYPGGRGETGLRSASGSL